MAKADKKKASTFAMPESEEEKKKALENAISMITKTYGSGAIMRLGESQTHLNVEAIQIGRAHV